MVAHELQDGLERLRHDVLYGGHSNNRSFYFLEQPDEPVTMTRQQLDDIFFYLQMLAKWLPVKS